TAWIFAALLLAAAGADAQTTHGPGEVLVVYNANSPVSAAIAAFYEQQRGVANVVAVHCADSALNSTNENIPLGAFNAQIAVPVNQYLSRHRGINFIVLTKGVPIRI